MLSNIPFNTQIFDGKLFAERILENEVRPVTKRLLADLGRSLRLDIIWIGDSPESAVYVKYKRQKAHECGIETVLHHLPEDTDQETVENLILDLNKKNEVTGYIIQLPVPRHINYHKLFELIDPGKDADGLSPFNLGKLWHYQDTVGAATPAGVFRILTEAANLKLEGKSVVILNDSDIVGKPLGAMLLREHATVSFCTKYTKNISDYTESADVVISATGVPGLIKGSMIKQGAVLIDVGTRKIEGKIYGDIEIESCLNKASFITPVPGGVGPVTVAMLIKNCVMLGNIG